MEKRRLYYFVLSCLTIAMLALLSFASINNLTHWVDLTAYGKIIEYVSSFGPIILVCLFAFASLFGKIMSKILFIVLLVLLIVFALCIFAPNVITSIFAGSTSTVFLG